MDRVIIIGSGHGRIIAALVLEAMGALLAADAQATPMDVIRMPFVRNPLDDYPFPVFAKLERPSQPCPTFGPFALPDHRVTRPPQAPSSYG